MELLTKRIFMAALPQLQGIQMKKAEQAVFL